jgi:hypothetical protein
MERHVEAADEAALPGRRVVERKEPEATADVEDRTRLGQVLADLVEEALAQDPEPRPAVQAHDGIVVSRDDPADDVSAHR